MFNLFKINFLNELWFWFEILDTPCICLWCIPNTDVKVLVVRSWLSAHISRKTCTCNTGSRVTCSINCPNAFMFATVFPRSFESVGPPCT